LIYLFIFVFVFSGYDTTLAKGFQPYVNTVLNATTKAITTYFVQQVPALNVTITKAVGMPASFCRVF